MSNLSNFPYLPLGSDVRSWAGVLSNFEHLRNWLNGANLDGANLDASAFAAYKSIGEAFGHGIGGGGGTGNGPGLFYLSTIGLDWQVQGGNLVHPCIFPVVAADMAMTGKTTKMRTRVSVASNNVNANATLTFGLYPVTFSASGVLTATLGSVVAGTTAAIVINSALVETNIASADYDPPADGVYVLGVNISAQMAANSVVTARAALQYHHI